MASTRQRLWIHQALVALGRAWRAAGLRFLLFLSVLAAGFLLLKLSPVADLLDRDHLVAALGQLHTAWWAPLALIGLYLLISPMGLPVSPLIIAGGVVFGVGWGILYNALGTVLGALASYFLALALGREFVEALTRGRLEKLEEFSLNRSFWPLVRVRFLPVPFPVVNFGAALAGVPVGKFLGASVAGLVPSMALWTTLWALMYQATVEERYDDTLPLIVITAVVASLAAFGPSLYRLAAGRALAPKEPERDLTLGGIGGQHPGLADPEVRETGAQALEGEGGPPERLP